MSDRNVELPSFELPPQPELGQEAVDNNVEAPVNTPETGGNQPGRQQQPVATPLPSQPIQLQTMAPASGPTNIVVKAPSSDDGLVAADADLIEKEWVDKAKEIVAKTQNDPHTQKEEISKVKAEYMEKRFKKTIKTDSTKPEKLPYETTARPVSPTLPTPVLPAPVNQPEQAG